ASRAGARQPVRGSRPQARRLRAPASDLGRGGIGGGWNRLVVSARAMGGLGAPQHAVEQAARDALGWSAPPRRTGGGRVSRTVDRAMAVLGVTAPDGYFVGGCVRDWLLGHPLKDLDVAVPDRVEQIGRQTADRLGGVFFWLRREMNVGR